MRINLTISMHKEVMKWLRETRAILGNSNLSYSFLFKLNNVSSEYYNHTRSFESAMKEISEVARYLKGLRKVYRETYKRDYITGKNGE